MKITNEEVVKAAKEHEKHSEFGKLANSELARSVTSAYGVGFIDGAEWALFMLTKRQSNINKQFKQK